MSIPISQIIEINPSVVGTGSNPLALNGLILTPSDNAPTNEILTCYSLDDVANYFGMASPEYKAAVPYFSANSIRSRVSPDSLLFIRYANASVGAWAKGKSIKGILISEITQNTGSLSVTIDGTAYSVEQLSLGDASNFTEVASAIQTQLALASGQSCTWNSEFSRFEIRSGTYGEDSSISEITGTASEVLGLDKAQLSQGSEFISPDMAVSYAASNHLNWATFTILFSSSVERATLESLAKWQATKNSRYFFIAWDNDANAVSSEAENTFGQWCKENGYNVLCCYNNVTVATMAMGMAASVNWNAVNGRAAFAFKSQEGMDTTVATLHEANALLGNGYSYYGAYAADGPANTYNFFYDGALGGEWMWSDSYIDQIFLNAQLRGAMIDLLMGVNTLPYNDFGKTLIRSAALDPINQGLNNGTIRTGITLSENQKAQVNAIVGFDISNELYMKGYYLYIGEASAQTRGQRKSPPIYFFYCDGGSIQRITIPSIAIL